MKLNKSNIIMDGQEKYRAIDLSHQPLFVQPHWLDCMLGSSNWSAIVALGNNGITRWAWAYATPSRHLGILKWTPPSFSTYNNIIILDNTEISNVLRELYKHIPFFSYIKIKYSKSHKETTKDIRLRVRQFYPHYDTLDEYWNTINKSKRKKLSKTFDIRVDEETNPDNLFKGLAGSLAKNNLHSIDINSIERIMACKASTIGMIVRNKNGRILGSQLIAWDSHTAYFLLRGKNYSKTHLPVSEILRWESIRFAHSKGLRIDLCGSQIPGVANFNREMGAQNEYYPEFIHFKPMLLKHISSMYKRKN